LTAKNFAERSILLLRNKDLRKKIGENGRKRIESDYSTSAMSQLYLRLYHHLRETDRPSIQALKGKRLESF